MTEIELLGQVVDKLDMLIKLTILFKIIQIGEGIFTMWKGGMKN